MRIQLAMAFALFATHASAEPCEAPRAAYIGDGFSKAGELVDLPDTYLIAYLNGFVDTALAASVLGASDGCVKRAEQCLKGKTLPQLVAIVRKHLKANPERWHMSANLQVFAALFMPCVHAPN